MERVEVQIGVVPIMGLVISDKKTAALIDTGFGNQKSATETDLEKQVSADFSKNSS